MNLDYRQKNYIKRNLRHFSVAKIAADLEVPENEILGYLRKKWSGEKYEKFLANRLAAESTTQGAISSFSFSNFVRDNRLVLAGLAVLVLAVYFNSFFNGFVSDDVQGYALNQKVGDISNIFAGPLRFSPQGLLSVIAYHLGGLHPFAFRVINIFLHLGSTILIFFILSLISKRNIAIVAASLFAVHPILIESVAWISGIPYSLYAFFFFFSFLFYILSKNNKKYLYFSVIFYTLALASSEKAVVLFFALMIYEFAYGSVRLNWKKILPHAFISFLLIVLYLTKIGARVSNVEALSYQQAQGYDNPLIQVPIAIVSYLGLIFWPDKLTLYHTEMSFSRGQFVFIYIIFLLFIGLLIYTFKKNRKAFFWLAFFVIILLPTITPFRISWTVAERYVYPGTLGIFVAVAMLVDKLASFNANAKIVAYSLLIMAIAGLSVRTIIRNADWKSEDSLWFATARVAPSGQNIHNNLGDVYARNGDLQKAVEEFMLAIQINPNYADAYHNLANTYHQMGQTEEAIKNYQKALEINPKIWQSYQNVASIYFEAGDIEAAYANIKKALEINPADPNLQANTKIIEERMQAK